MPLHVGYAPVFQNPGNALSDAQVYEEELRIAEMAEPLGFDSIWAIEHHFTDYTMCPDPVQFLSYMAGKTKTAKLGTMVIVLPWHDPIRVAEQVSLLDHVSDGRMILGVGRGLARVEYEGFRIDQNEGRDRFVEYAELLLNGLENGYIEGGLATKQPHRDIRPYPKYSFKGRTYAAAVSPESAPIMAKLGIGLLVIPQKPWETVQQDFEIYHSVWKEHHTDAPPKPFCGGFFYVNEDAKKAEENANKWIGAYYHTAMNHYEMGGKGFGKHKGYEFYSNVGEYIEKHGRDGAAQDFVKLMPWGNPDQLLRKLENIREMIDMKGIMCNFSFAGMPYPEAEESMKCFAKHVLPELKKWDTSPLPEPKPLTMPAPASAAA